MPVWHGTGNAWIRTTDDAFNQCALDETNTQRWLDCVELDIAYYGAPFMNVLLGPEDGLFTVNPI